ncbi:MAG: sigma-70 family RNA polymerase sigma factor [Boseongicola sp.]|nr:MAG: sigma-70 family RNA polymerase sigma factor [Boseongicola sp.]
MAEDKADSDLADVLGGILRKDRGQLLAALIGAVGDFDLAEDCLSDAVERALVHWKRSGIPRSPKGWLLQVGRRSAIDRIRRGRRLAARAPDIERLMEEDQESRNAKPEEIPDERLRLIFTCCHPALEEKTRIALTLRTVGGLTTREIARAFLDSEVNIGQRLSRARSKIGAATIPYVVPERADWDARLGSVLTVIYLIFNEGWTAGAGEAPIRNRLCDEAIFLARLMCQLAPEESEIEGLLALMLLTHARHGARHQTGRGFIPLDQQDRRLWDDAMISEGLNVLDAAVARQNVGPFQCQAAIHALHVQSDSDVGTDWAQIVLLYDRLLEFQPSPVVRLNRAVALAETGSLDLALSEVRGLKEELPRYQPYYAALAELEARAGTKTAARDAMDMAIKLSSSDDEKRWLAAKRQQLE